MDEGSTEIDRRDGEREVDLTDRLRFAAGSLVADLGDEISVDHAEALVFSSAEGLLAAASVTEFVPILAERRARLAARSAALATGAKVPPPAPAPAGAPQRLPATAPAQGAPPPPRSAGGRPETVEVPPLLAVPEREITRLRNDVERLRMRVADWRSDVRRRGRPPV